METAEDPFAELDMLVEALSEMAKPYGYVVEALSGTNELPALGIRKPGGEWLDMICAARPEGGDSFFFPDKESGAAALVSKYGSRLSWDTYFFAGRETRLPGGSPEELKPDRRSLKMVELRFPGGSPEELSLKAAAGVRAVLVSR